MNYSVFAMLIGMITAFCIGATTSYSITMYQEMRKVEAVVEEDFDPALERTDELTNRLETLMLLVDAKLPCHTDYECEVLYPMIRGSQYPLPSSDNPFSTGTDD